MKTIIAIVVLSASVGLTTYHWTGNGKAPPDQSVTAFREAGSHSTLDWRSARLSAPVPLNIVSPGRETKMVRNGSLQPTVAKQPLGPQSAVFSQSRLVPESEKPCRAQKPARSPVQVAVKLPSEATSSPATAIPVAAERVLEEPPIVDAVSSISEASSPMPMRRYCCPPRRTRTDASYAIDRHLRPGARFRP